MRVHITTSDNANFHPRKRWKIFTRQRRGHLPVHGVQRVGLVVVPALLVAHVDGDGRVEGGEDVVVGCRNRKAEKKTELDEGGREGEETSKHTHTKKGCERNFKANGLQ